MQGNQMMQPADSPNGNNEDSSQLQLGDGNNVGSLTESGNIDKIREILFGVQMRDYQKKFSRLEERILKDSADLREDTRKRFDSLENFVKNEFEALTNRLHAEQRTRDDAMRNLSEELQKTGKTFERKLSELDEQTTRSHRDLRNQILEQSKTLGEDIRHKHDEMSAMLAREVAELGTAKTDRASLAGLFTEVALRLNNEFKIPGEG
jgi:exonuclease VII large subunit